MLIVNRMMIEAERMTRTPRQRAFAEQRLFSGSRSKAPVNVVEQPRRSRSEKLSRSISPLRGGYPIGTFQTLNLCTDGELSTMAEVPRTLDPRAEFVRKVARETGITEEQVKYLISILGYDHPSIVREARILKKGDT